MNITQAGIGSGLQLESIIEAFITAESVPVEIRLQEKEERTRLELSGLGSFKSALSDFQSVLKKLDTLDEFYQQTVTSSNEDISVTTNGYATDGTFDVVVDTLATATRIQTTDFADATTTVGSGTLTLSSANGDTFDVAIDAADDLSAIRDKINSASDNFGVQVTVVTHDGGTYLSYGSSAVGTDNALTVSSVDAGLSSLTSADAGTTVTAAVDGVIFIDGNQVTNTSSNEYKNYIEDVTITANAVSATGDSSTLSITQDTSVPRTIIEDFVNGYNALVESMTGLGAPSLGRLAFDSDLRTMRGQLSNIMSSTVSGMTGDIDALSSIGILIDRNGKLEISAAGIGSLPSGSAQLTDAIENNLGEVGKLFAEDGGIVSQLTDLIDSYTGTDGSLSVRETALNSTLSDISDEWDAHEAWLRDYEETLRSRFAFLDSTVAAYDATGAWLANALKVPTKSSE